MAKQEFFYYPLASSLQSGSWSQHSIKAYYTFGSGQTVVELAIGEYKPIRVPKSHFRSVRQSSFESYPSISTINSPKKLFRWMMDKKIIPGEYCVPDTQKMNMEELMKRGLTTEQRFLSSKTFQKWHASVKRQLFEIKSDKSDFKTESIKTESINLIKGTIKFIQQKYKWNAADLKEIVDESAREFLIQDVIDN